MRETYWRFSTYSSFYSHVDYCKNAYGMTDEQIANHFKVPVWVISATLIKEDMK